MTLSSVIQGKIETSARPTREVLDTLHKAMQAYERTFLVQCQQVVEAPLAVCLGVEPDPLVDLSQERQALKHALTRALALVERRTEAAEVRIQNKALEAEPLTKTVEPPRLETKPRVVKPVLEEAIPRVSPYPKLQRTFPTKGIIMVGGFKVPGKLESIVENYGILVDWVVFEKGSPRIIDSIEARIKNGKVGAVIILEGLMTHKDFRKISAACKVKGVPYTMGDKGGNGALGKAFQQLESRIR